MHYPSVFNRVRVIDRDGEFVILRVDHLACIVDLYPTQGGTAIEINVPFNRLSESPSFAPMESDSNFEYVFSETQTVLDRSSANLRASHRIAHASRTASADLQERFRATFEIIRMSQRLIMESDELIDRAQFRVPPPARDEENPLISLA